MYDVNILHLIEGAKEAQGLTVIIDVFRAFSLEYYLYDMDVEQIRPVGTIEEAFSLKHHIQNSVLIGERHGKKYDGFDYGNSPSSISKKDVMAVNISLINPDKVSFLKPIFIKRLDKSGGK